MTAQSSNSPTFLKTLGQEIADVGKTIADEWRTFWVNLRNQLRIMQDAKVDYVVMPLSGGLPERDEPPRSFIERQLPLPAPTISIETLLRRFRRITRADNASGVLLLFQGFSGGFGTLQSVRDGIHLLREAGKEVVVYTPYLDAAHYYVACAADKIIIPPSAQFDVLGFRAEVALYKEALAKAGIAVEAVQISPYKSGPDMYTKAEMTPEFEAMINWLLDDRFEMLVTAVAQGRNLSPETVKTLIDKAPIFAEQAVAEGLVDALGYEDELEQLLAPKSEIEAETTAVSENVEEADSAKKEGEKTAVSLKTWQDAKPILLERPQKRIKKYIGVVSLQGTIMRGKSQDPPIDLPIPIVGGQTAGDQTLTAVLRQAEADDKMAALIFHVDSPGGDALASDLIGREIERLSRKIPVVVYMGDVAASGGYYVSALARHIVCQPGTTTGSIGVYMMKPNLEGFNEKVAIKQFAFQRGENADLYSPNEVSDSQRALFWNGINETYRQFKEVVAKGRDIPFDELDPICEGRVWTGQQALERELVDSLGNFETAVQIAIELADLPVDAQTAVPVVNMYGKKASYQLPNPIETAEYLKNLLSYQTVQPLFHRPLMLLPFKLDIW